MNKSESGAENTVIARGRDAWEAIKASPKVLREDWYALGKALALGRSVSKDGHAFRRWCTEHDLRGISAFTQVGAETYAKSKSPRGTLPIEIREWYRNREKKSRGRHGEADGRSEEIAADVETATRTDETAPTPESLQQRSAEPGVPDAQLNAIAELVGQAAEGLLHAAQTLRAAAHLIEDAGRSGALSDGARPGLEALLESVAGLVRTLH